MAHNLKDQTTHSNLSSAFAMTARRPGRPRTQTKEEERAKRAERMRIKRRKVMLEKGSFRVYLHGELGNRWAQIAEAEKIPLDQVAAFLVLHYERSQKSQALERTPSPNSSSRTPHVIVNSLDSSRSSAHTRELDDSPESDLDPERDPLEYFGTHLEDVKAEVHTYSSSRVFVMEGEEFGGESEGEEPIANEMKFSCSQNFRATLD